MKKAENGGKRIVLLISFLSVSAYLFLFPEPAAEDVTRALHLCAGSLVPALFPFLVLGNLYAKSGLATALGKWVGGPFSTILGVPERSAGIVLLGLFAGFPTGAAAAARLYRSGGCTKQEAERAVALSNQPSPAFVLAAVGFAAFGSVEIGLLLLAAELISLVLASILLRVFAARRPAEEAVWSVDPAHDTIEGGKYPSFLSAFTGAVKDAAYAMLVICGYVIFFSVLSGIAVAVFNRYGGFMPSSVTDLLSCTIRGCFELTSGVLTAPSTLFPANLFLASALIGFGGLAAIFQVASICTDNGIRMREFLTVRLFCALAEPAVLFLLLPLFPVTTSTAALAVPYAPWYTPNIDYRGAFLFLVCYSAALFLFFGVGYFVIDRAEKRAASKNKGKKA